MAPPPAGGARELRGRPLRMRAAGQPALRTCVQGAGGETISSCGGEPQAALLEEPWRSAAPPSVPPSGYGAGGRSRPPLQAGGSHVGVGGARSPGVTSRTCARLGDGRWWPLAGARTSVWREG